MATTPGNVFFVAKEKFSKFNMKDTSIDGIRAELAEQFSRENDHE